GIHLLNETERPTLPEWATALFRNDVHGYLEQSTRASNGRIQRRCSRHLDYRAAQCRHITTDVSDSGPRVGGERARLPLCSSSPLPPSPPAENATARQHQAYQAG